MDRQNNRDHSENCTSGRSPLNKDVIDKLVVYVDSCNYGRLGLQSALEQYAVSVGSAFLFSTTSSAEALKKIPSYTDSELTVRTLVVRLPPLAREALITLLQLSEITQYSTAKYHQLVVLSPFDTMIVQHFVSKIGMTNMYIVNARLRPSILCHMMQLPMINEWSTTRQKKNTLSGHECNVLLQSLLRQVSTKTVYNQRTRALMKLGVRDIRILLNLLAKGKDSS